MKRLILTILVIGLVGFIQGCATISGSSTSEQEKYAATVRIVARHLGAELAKDHKLKIACLTFSNVILNAKDETTIQDLLADEFAKLLKENIGDDELFLEDMKDLAALWGVDLTVPNIGTTPFDKLKDTILGCFSKVTGGIVTDQLKSVLSAFKRGLELG